MKKSILSLFIGAAFLMAGGAFAQSRGEADPAGALAAPSKPSTKAEKQAAKTSRKAEGKDVAKTASVSDTPESAAVHTKQTKEERKKANAERRAKNVGVAKEPKIDKSPN
jgi:hypothetical protein